MKELFDGLIIKYELQRDVVTELIQKSDIKENVNKELAVRRFLINIIQDLKVCAKYYENN